MPEIQVTEKGVLKLLQALNISKAAGPDGKRPRVLKELSSELVPIFNLLFQESIHQQSLPDISKHANVNPIYKKGDKTNPSNYRPVSLTCISCKGKTLGWIGSFLSGRSQKVVLEGKSSSSAPVLSGVPQDSVLGPVLFLIYINDLPEYVSNSTVRLFADDTLLYLTIHNSSDCIKLQEELNNLERWESDWQMSFHPDKCEVIHITTKKKPIIHKYTLHGHTLSSVPQIKYLGVNIFQDLKWNSHINSVSSKANQTLGGLKRNLKINSQPIKEKAYKSIVRPKLEY